MSVRLSCASYLNGDPIPSHIVFDVAEARLDSICGQLALAGQLTIEVDMQLLLVTSTFDYRKRGRDILSIEFYTSALTRGKADTTHYSVPQRECPGGRCRRERRQAPVNVSAVGFSRGLHSLLVDIFWLPPPRWWEYPISPRHRRVPWY